MTNKLTGGRMSRGRSDEGTKGKESELCLEAWQNKSVLLAEEEEIVSFTAAF